MHVHFQSTRRTWVGGELEGGEHDNEQQGDGDEGVVAVASSEVHEEQDDANESSGEDGEGEGEEHPKGEAHATLRAVLALLLGITCGDESLVDGVSIVDQDDLLQDEEHERANAREPHLK